MERQDLQAPALGLISGVDRATSHGRLIAAMQQRRYGPIAVIPGSGLMGRVVNYHRNYWCVARFSRKLDWRLT
jgi:hypothetical protein